MLNENSGVRAGATEMLEKENGMKIAQFLWVNRKDSSKTYEPMVVHLEERADEARLLKGQYFDVDGESASV